MEIITNVFPGLTSFIYGMIIIIMDLYFPSVIADFFHMDVLVENDKFYHNEETKEDVAQAESNMEGIIL